MKPITPSIATPVKSTTSKVVAGAVAAVVLTGSGLLLWKLANPSKKDDKPAIVQNEPGSGKSAPTDGPLILDEPVGPDKVVALPVPNPGPVGNPHGDPGHAPILAIPRNPTGAEGVPKGFGFAEDPLTGFPTEETPKGLVELEKPTTEPAPAPAPPPPAPVATPDPVSPVETADPRNIGITANDGPEKEFEETSLTVQRTLTAVSGEEKQLIRLKIPVMYQSRTMRLEGDKLTEAHRIQKALKEKAVQLRNMKAEMEVLLKDWNTLVENTTPQDVLLPESPTLPQNQSANTLNRAKDETMAPGKSITFEVLDK